MSQEMETDQSLYLRALKEPHNGPKICSEITNDDVQGECILFSATDGGFGTDACGFARTEKWKEACFFEVIDKKGVPKHQAKDSCARTGRFVNRCVYHIIQREEQLWMKRFPMGQEQEMSDAIQKEIVLLGGTELTNDPLSKTLVSRIVARRFLKEWRKDQKVLFSSRFCGNLDRNGCRRAYRFVIRLQQSKHNLCSRSHTIDSFANAQVPYWEAPFAEDARRVWSELCRQYNQPE